ANTGIAGLHINGKTPEAGAIFRVVKSILVINAGNNTDNTVVGGVFSDQIGESLRVAMFHQKIFIDGYHAMRFQYAVYADSIILVLQLANNKALWMNTRRQIMTEPESIGM